MKNLINFAKFNNGMLLNLSLAIGIAMFSSCAKEQSATPSAAINNSHSAYKAPEGDEPLLTIRKEAGRADFAIYNIFVTARGVVTFEGIKGVNFIGIKEFQLDEAQVWGLAYEMRDQGFNELRDEYPYVEGAGARTTMLNVDDESAKKVIDFGDAPDQLIEIERQLIDRLELRDMIGD